MYFQRAHLYKFEDKGGSKKVPHETAIYLNMKITKFKINMNIIMWRNLLFVSGFLPVNFGTSIQKL